MNTCRFAASLDGPPTPLLALAGVDGRGDLRTALDLIDARRIVVEHAIRAAELSPTNDPNVGTRLEQMRGILENLTSASASLAAAIWPRQELPS